MKLLPKSYVSFFSSGFPSHVMIKAMDLGEGGNVFHSPFSGEIISIRKFKVGRPNRFAKTDFDVQIIIKTKNDRRIKILHINPYKSEGEYVNEGETLGEYISSPYTGGDFPHAHIEGIRLTFPKIKKYTEEAIGKIVAVNKFYFDIELKTFSEAGNLRGLGCCGGLLNASLPYAGYGGIIGTKIVSDLKIPNLGVYYSYRNRRKNLSLFEMRKGLIKNWEYESTFKVMKNEPIGGPALFESILSFKGFPLIRIFRKTERKEGEEINFWEYLRSQ
ncbi:hypothetical protein DFR86_10850 [Acidianus sulfidivorans JP7]|uniref:DUF8155 domain-containing protein n=1 Tax=Acidianus sulfidivorans JP7 TaxID=619593 RepID=A0A2U9IPT3_9CREN|nr:hypothetical protein [Acidianus sulfidivorans]AWR97984.1 hypothetical protein DFR86_10850 [Acidianus sulfidivorans JP7]